MAKMCVTHDDPFGCFFKSANKEERLTCLSTLNPCAKGWTVAPVVGAFPVNACIMSCNVVESAPGISDAANCCTCYNSYFKLVNVYYLIYHTSQLLYITFTQISGMFLAKCTKKLTALTCGGRCSLDPGVEK